MIDIKQLKKELGISQKDIADFFQMSYGAYANSTAKERYEEALCRFYEVVKNKDVAKSNKKCPQCNNNYVGKSEDRTQYICANFHRWDIEKRI